MKSIAITGIAALLCANIGITSSQADTAEVIDTLRTHYVDRDALSDKFLSDASVAGILQALGPGAVLLDPAPLTTNAPSAPRPAAALARAEIIQPDIGYIRLADVVEETATALDGELKKFAEAKTTGYVLDLRYADGTNYAAAAAVAGRFLPASAEVFSIKNKTGAAASFRAEPPSSSPAPGISSAPLMILMNSETRGSAEALAVALRHCDRALLIGGRTAGSAVAWEEFKLNDGRLLRVATAKLVLSGMEVFPKGLVPDIPVKIDPTVERDVVLTAQTNLTLTASLQPRQKRATAPEADLVKAYRGDPLERPSSKDEKLEETQPVRDVVLQRAVDILKGIRAWSSRNDL